MVNRFTVFFKNEVNFSSIVSAHSNSRQQRGRGAPGPPLPSRRLRRAFLLLPASSLLFSSAPLLCGIIALINDKK
jgi:hypothetical protein